MEDWKNGMLITKKINPLLKSFYLRNIHQYRITSLFQNPFFHHSSIPTFQL